MKDFDIRKYNIRLTKDGLHAPITKRAKRALVTIKKFVEKHTRAKEGNVLIGEELNKEIWKNGVKNPPRKVSVFVQRLKQNPELVFVNLEGAPIKIEIDKTKKEEKKKEKKEEEKTLEEITEEGKVPEKKASENTPSKKKK